MLAAQAQVRAYQAAMNEFVACIDSELEAQGEQAPAEFKSLMVARHNAAVAEMEGVAAAFNEQLRAFRAANPAPASELTVRLLLSCHAAPSRGAAFVSGAEILELLLQVVALVGHDALEHAHALFDLVEPLE